MTPYETTIRQLRAYRKKSSSIIVSYSGGKDSCVVMDLCVKEIPEVQAFFMEFVPGLDYTAGIVEKCIKTWGVTPLLLPAWQFYQGIHHGFYRLSRQETRDGADGITLPLVHQAARQHFGINTIATGYRTSDSPWRRQTMGSHSKETEKLIHPLAGWNKWHVLAYAKEHNLPIPTDTSADDGSGLSLSVQSIFWLYDYHPSDFWRLQSWFPFIEAVIARREYYGQPVEKTPQSRKYPDEGGSPESVEGGGLQPASDNGGGAEDAQEVAQ